MSYDPGRFKGFFLFGISTISGILAAQNRPDIILILADDMGYI
jgi:hypothetical protein